MVSRTTELYITYATLMGATITNINRNAKDVHFAHSWRVEGHGVTAFSTSAHDACRQWLQTKQRFVNENGELDEIPRSSNGRLPPRVTW